MGRKTEVEYFFLFFFFFFSKELTLQLWQKNKQKPYFIMLFCTISTVLLVMGNTPGMRKPDKDFIKGEVLLSGESNVSNDQQTAKTVYCYNGECMSRPSSVTLESITIHYFKKMKGIYTEKREKYNRDMNRLRMLIDSITFLIARKPIHNV